MLRGVARRTGPEVKHPVQESGLQCSSVSVRM